jgi:ABC-type multidrug transport system ATPase subunit
VTIGDPPLLLLDEPSNGLDPEGQSDICHHIADLHATGKTIVLASHQLQEVTEVCTYLIILNHGNIHYENSVADALSERPHVVIQVDQDTSSIQEIVKNLDHDIEVSEQEVILNNEAIYLRRQVLSILLSLGFDVVRVRQSRVTLAEIYAEAVR